VDILKAFSKIIPVSPGGLWKGRAIAGAVTTAAVILLHAFSPLMITRVEFYLYDMALPLRAAKNPSAVPIIIDIDERSLEMFRQWPWPRYLVADLVTGLLDGGVAAVGFDVLFTERDNTSPKEITEYLRLHKNLDVKFDGLPGEMRDYDALLADAIRGKPVVLAAYADPGAELPEEGIPDTVNLITRTPRGMGAYAEKIQDARGALLPLEELRPAPVGLVNIMPDPDGVIRKIPMAMSVNGHFYPTLSLRTLMAALGTENLIAGYGSGGLEYLRASPYTIPVAPDGTMRIPFIGPQWTYEYVSAGDVLNGLVPLGKLEGRVAFVGSSARGLADLYPTPHDQIYPGVEVHAAVLDAILTGNQISVPARASMIQVIAILAAGAASLLLFGFAPPVVYIPAGAGIAAAITAASMAAFAGGLFVPPVYPVITVAANAAALIQHRFRQGEMQKLKIAADLAEERARRAGEQAELDTARRIQAGALTRSFPPFDNFREAEAYALMRPARNVGGDFYDCFMVGENRLVMIMADVSGKGIPAALFMMSARMIIKNLAMTGLSPGEILTAANSQLCDDNDAGMFITAFAGIYDRRRGVLEYANAGHNPPVLLRGDCAEWLDVEKNFVLGGMEGIPYGEQEVAFAGGDAIIMYTDGVTEMMDERNELFGDGRLMELAGRISRLAPREMTAAIDAEVTAFAGSAEQSDDVTILAARVANAIQGGGAPA
jgi:serine phosphatase RsbU (regulator of sigma subunit)/CHASE2 domain-containing sensor protein